MNKSLFAQVNFCVNYALTLIDIDREVTEMGEKQVSMVSDMGPNFDRLWSYSCKLTNGRNISCMSWNKLNPVSYLTIVNK